MRERLNRRVRFTSLFPFFSSFQKKPYLLIREFDNFRPKLKGNFSDIFFRFLSRVLRGFSRVNFENDLKPFLHSGLSNNLSRYLINRDC